MAIAKITLIKNANFFGLKDERIEKSAVLQVEFECKIVEWVG